MDEPKREGRRDRVRALAEVPGHVDAVALRPLPVALGCVLAALLVAGGLMAVLWAPDAAGRRVGAVPIAAGMLLVAVVLRCRRFTTSVASLWLETRVGPFRRRPARSRVRGTVARPARSWRRLYAEHEVSVELDDELLVVPSQCPADLVAALSADPGA